MKSDRLLSSCIKIEEKRISRQLSIPSQVYFELNPDIVALIGEVKAIYGSLYLNPEQITNLRYYSLINSRLIDGDRLSLVFSSNYLSSNSQSQTTVVRSTLDLSGKISQEVRQDLWQDFQLSSQVIQAHHWLIAEILRQLPVESKSYTTSIFWTLWLPIAIAFTFLIWLWLPLSFSLKAIAILAFLLLSKLLVKHLIDFRLRQWIVHQLIYGWLSNKINKRQLGFKLLALL